MRYHLKRLLPGNRYLMKKSLSFDSSMSLQSLQRVSANVLKFHLNLNVAVFIGTWKVGFS
jgi:hypothetical protein